MHTEKTIRNAPDSDYMNPLQIAFFRRRLQAMRREILRSLSGVQQLLTRTETLADECDQANESNTWWNTLTLNSRETDRLREIDAALLRIAEGSYGFCEQTGERIGIPRLLAYPVASLSMEAMARQEYQNRLGRCGLRPVVSYA